MSEPREPGAQAYLSRTDVEIELAKLALVVMRAAPQAFGELAPARGHAEGGVFPADCASRLLARTRPEHRVFVQGRLQELARCMPGAAAGDAQEWLNVAMELSAPPADMALPQELERRTRR